MHYLKFCYFLSKENIDQLKEDLTHLMQSIFQLEKESTISSVVNLLRNFLGIEVQDITFPESKELKQYKGNVIFWNLFFLLESFE